MAQLSYSRSPRVGRSGQIADPRPRTVLSRVCKAAVPFGFFVVNDTTIPASGVIPGVAAGGNPTADGCKLPGASSDITGTIGLGVALETLSIESVPRVSYENLVQSLMSQNVPVSGVIQLNFAGQQTTNINWNDNAATIQTKIAALSNVGTGNVTVVGSFNAGPVIVTFQGVLAGQAVSLMTAPQANNTMLDTNGYAVVPGIWEVVPYADLPVYPAGHEINVLEKGAVWVYTETDVTPTSTVYVRYAADLVNFPSSGPGAFSGITDSGSNAVLSNARWMSNGVANGVALLEIDLI